MDETKKQMSSALHSTQALGIELRGDAVGAAALRKRKMWKVVGGTL